MTEIKLILLCILLHNCYVKQHLRKLEYFSLVTDKAGNMLWPGNCSWSSSDPAGGGMRRVKGEDLAYPFFCCAMFSQENELLLMLSFPSPGWIHSTDFMIRVENLEISHKMEEKIGSGWSFSRALWLELQHGQDEGTVVWVPPALGSREL